MKGWIASSLVLTALFSTKGQATCLPEMDYSVPAEFKRSDIVAIVRAKSVTWLDEHRKPTRLKGKLTYGDIPGGFDPYLGAYYSVTVQELIKGKVSTHFRIFSENTTARTPLLLDRPLLLFIKRVRTNDAYAIAGDYVVDNCGNSSAADRPTKALSQVRLLARQRNAK